MRTALVTGYSGFIGRRLALRLAHMPDVNLVLLGRSSPDNALQAATHIAADLTELGATTWDALNCPVPGVVFHLAAFMPKTRVDADRFDEVFETNVVGTASLLKMLPRRRLRFIFASSVDVYARGKGLLTESSVVDPISFYGCSKWFAERYVRAFCDAESFSYAILRYGHIYGPGEDAFEKFIPTAIKRMIHGKAPILHGDGSAQRDFLFVDDAVEATIRAAFHVTESIRTLNVVSGQSHSMREIAEILRDVTGLDAPASFEPGNAGDSLLFDNALMRETLGTWPQTELRAGLASEVGDFRSRNVS